MLQELEHDVRRALDTVVDPELDESITDLGFVSSLAIDGDSVEVHLRLPTSFCAPNFAWLMASDAQTAVAGVRGVRNVAVVLDDHTDSTLINRGLAAGAGYRGTFGSEAEDSLDYLRTTFQRKAQIAAMERAITAWLHGDRSRTEADVADLTLGALPAGSPETVTLMRRRAAVGMSLDDAAPVLLRADGTRPPPEQVPLELRRARAVRISVDGNAHFCRGLLRTRYPGAENDQAPRPDGEGTSRPPLPILSRTTESLEG